MVPSVEENLGVYGNGGVVAWQTIVINISRGVQFLAGDK
jgi:hypothetical protein